MAQGKGKIDLPALDEDGQYEGIAREMLRRAEKDLVNDIKEALKKSGGGRGDRVSWSRD